MHSRLHSWRVSPRTAVQIQERLRHRVILDRPPAVIGTVAGIDVSYDAATQEMIAGIIVFDRMSLTPIDSATAVAKASFPYVPGLLSFREIPAVLLAWKRLKRFPDCLLCDGQGLAHPRRFGLASHLGVWLDLPSIGCAKSRLVGRYREPGRGRGSRSPLMDRGERVGTVLRTRDGVKPVFVSPGHRMTFDRSTALVLSCCRRYRISEPIRQAHLLVNAVRRERYSDES